MIHITKNIEPKMISQMQVTKNVVSEMMAQMQVTMFC